ncbi:MAG: HEPN domain-containing protein [Armatimonadetes bacterium]|nr:HEPN domain-containing protein [Armatimonadota bacterium]
MTQSASRWLEFARTDLRSAEVLLEEDIYSSAAFHCQQAAEKALKAVFAAKGTVAPRVHDLVELLGELSKYSDVYAQHQDDVAYLSRFYLPVRYPDALPGTLPEGLPSKDHATQAVEKARRILELVWQEVVGCGPASEDMRPGIPTTVVS